MIAHRITGRHSGGSYDVSLATYRSIEEYINDKAEFAFTSDNICSPGSAAMEMFAAGLKSPNLEDPIYHLVISWPRGEKPTAEQCEEAIFRTAAALGFDGHQWVGGLHLDQDNYHLHVAINRVHPDTGKPRTPRMDFKTLEQTMRTIEIDQGWSHDRGRWYEVEYVDDRPYVVEREPYARTIALSKSAQNFERYTGKQSFQGWLLEEGGEQLRNLLNECSTWREVHTNLQAVGLELREVQHQNRKGLVLVDPLDETRAGKVSLLGAGYGRWWLEHRLGEYEPREEFQDAAKSILDNLVKMDSVFTMADLERQARMYTPEAVEQDALIRLVIGNDDVVELDGGKTRGRKFTTKTVLAEEQRAIEAAKRLADRPGQALNTEAVTRAIERRTMRDDQLDAFQRAIEAPGIAVWRGKAGVGKSYSMNAVREAHEDSGFKVLGLAPTNAVVGDMEADGFRDAHTVDSFLLQLENGKASLSSRTMIIVDEAGMLDSGKLADLLEAADKAQSKVLLVGDDRQLAAVGRGGMFGLLKQKYAAGEISVITRQKVDWQQQSASEFGDGEFERGMLRYHENDRLHFRGSDDEAMEALIEAWKADSAAEPAKTRFVFAYTNKQVDCLNEALREIRKARGELGAEMETATAHGQQKFAVGDRILITETNKRLGVTNGMGGTVLGVDQRTYSVTFKPDKGDAITLQLGTKKGQFGGIRLGYAGTIHKGQGRTIDRTFLLHSSHWRDAASYVALTRQKEDCHVYASREAATDWRDLARQMSRDGRKITASEHEVIEKQVPAAEEIPEPRAGGGEAGPVGKEAGEAPAEEVQAAKGGLSAMMKAAARDRDTIRDPEERKRRREERAAARQALFEEYKSTQEARTASARAAWREQVTAWRAKRDEVVAAMKATHAEERKALWGLETPSPVRQAMVSVHADECREALARLREELRDERDQIGDSPRPMTWEQFVREKAEAGDPVAASVLRGMEYRSKREEAETYDEMVHGEVAADDVEPAAVQDDSHKLKPGMGLSGLGRRQPEPEPPENSDAELRIMRDLDLVEVIQGFGWQREPKEQTADPHGRWTSQKWVGPAGEKISVKVERGRGVVYMNVLDPSDAGRAIDFAQRHAGVDHLSLGEARKALRPFLAGHVAPRPVTEYRQERPEEAVPDVTEVRKRFFGATLAVGGKGDFAHRRGISQSTLEALSDHIRVDRHKNLLFAHHDGAGNIVGYEVRGPRFKGFAKGGRKQLAMWGDPAPLRLYLTEGGIDALSLYQMHVEADKCSGAAYASTGGGVSERQLDRLADLAREHPYSEIVLAFDADEAGDALSRRVQHGLENRDIAEDRFRRLTPSRGKDWNENLMLRQQSRQSTISQEPSNGVVRP